MPSRVSSILLITTDKDGGLWCSRGGCSDANAEDTDPGLHLSFLPYHHVPSTALTLLTPQQTTTLCTSHARVPTTLVCLRDDFKTWFEEAV